MMILVYKSVVCNFLQAKIANAKIGFGKAKAHGWVELIKCDNGVQKVARKVCLLFYLLSYSLCVERVFNQIRVTYFIIQPSVNRTEYEYEHVIQKFTKKFDRI